MSELWELVDKLRPWPPLQFAVVLAIVGVGVATYWHVLRVKWGQPPASAKPEIEALLLFHGPFSRLEARLDTIVANQGLNKAEMREAFAEALRDTRHSLANKLAETQAELKEDVAHSEVNIRGDVSGMRRELRDLRTVADSINGLTTRIEARRRST